MNNYYVYKYVRSRKTSHGLAGSPYYIGKGSGSRAWSGVRGIERPLDKSKIVIIADNMSETDAFQAEMLLIHYYGRIDLGTGCLQNRTDGGGSVKGYIRTPAVKKAASARMKKRWDDFYSTRTLADRINDRANGIPIRPKAKSGLIVEPII